MILRVMSYVANGIILAFTALTAVLTAVDADSVMVSATGTEVLGYAIALLCPPSGSVLTIVILAFDAKPMVLRIAATIFSSLTVIIGILMLSHMLLAASDAERLGGLLLAVIYTWAGTTSVLSIWHPQARKYPASPSVTQQLGFGRFRVAGVDRESGFDTELLIDANSTDNAKIKAELKGMVVSRVSRI